MAWTWVLLNRSTSFAKRISDRPGGKSRSPARKTRFGRRPSSIRYQQRVRISKGSEFGVPIVTREACWQREAKPPPPPPPPRVAVRRGEEEEEGGAAADQGRSRRESAAAAAAALRCLPLFLSLSLPAARLPSGNGESEC